MNSNSDTDSDSDSDRDSSDNGPNKKGRLMSDRSVPNYHAAATLEERLRELEKHDAMTASTGKRNTKVNKRKRSHDLSTLENNNDSDSPGAEDMHRRNKKKKRHKNAPAEMRSNRPVSRFRDNITEQTSTNKFRDPRFSEISGTLDADKFLHSYSFLDKRQEEEVAKMTKTLKKVKNLERQQNLNNELQHTKQEMIERRRDMKLREKMRNLKEAEKEKIKLGKNPFFLKRSAVKEVALEQRYEELKSSGKLNSFLAKKRQKNSNKDHKLLPRSRRV